MNVKKEDTPNLNLQSLQGKTLLVVNTGWIKKRFIFQRLKKLGVSVIVLHKEKNWAAPYVDHWILGNTYHHAESIQAVKDFLKEHTSITIDGVVTFWEDDIPLHAKLCSELKLPGNPYDAAINTRDKFKMQEILKSTGQPYIRQKLLHSKTDLTAAVEEIGFPAVIKPVMGANSEFVVLVADVEEAQDAYSYVVKNCTPEFDPIYVYNKGLFIYQEYIDGHEFSLECFSQHGVPHIVGIHEKTAMDHPFFVETGDYIPPRIGKEQEEMLVKTAEAAMIIMGVRDSLAHVEIKLTKNGPKVIEVASRMGGDYTFETMQQVYGFDLIRAAGEIACGINVSSLNGDVQTYVMGKYFIPKTSGIITKVSGIDELKENEHVLKYMLFKKVGDSVLIPPDGFESIGWVLVEGTSYAELERRIGRVFETVNIEVVPFKSYSTVGKTVRKNRFSSALLTTSGRVNKIERLRKVSKKNQKKLHIGIACNIYEEENGNEVERDLMSVGKNIEKTLAERGYRVTFFDFNNLQKAFGDLKSSDIDIVFNVCERINNSSLLEPHAAAILDTLQIPYTGSNPFTLALCIDKIRVKKLLTYHSIPTPKWDYAYDLDDELSDELQYPLIVKPGNTDNSIGITNDSVVTNKKELQKQLEHVITKLSRPALVEEYIDGDEYDVSILGSEYDDFQVLPLSRSMFQDMPEGYWHIYAFDSKWHEKNIYDKIRMQRPPKNISRRLQSLITEIALDTYNILDCHDYGRIEIRVDKQGNPYVLELNPNPSINIDDCVPACAELEGMDYGDFLEEIIRLAIRRYRNRPPYYHLQANMI